MDRQDKQDKYYFAGLPEVGGRRVETSLAEFERKCLVLIAEEQRKGWTENHVIGALCDAVRLCREHADYVQRNLEIPLGKVPASKIADLVKDALATDGTDHKQFYLEQIAAELGVDVREMRRYSYIKHGIAP